VAGSPQPQLNFINSCNTPLIFQHHNFITASNALTEGLHVLTFVIRQLV
jgi:hypothetical protein